ncbi:sensor histidine kinase [Bacillus haimaensis]|uniref:sensor histidine kinase n=1 Tax=Bacillus haimaensis TaxID=3160967 RepID=UPI003AA912B2
MDEKRFFLLKKENGKEKLMLSYRYASWAVTSIFYFAIQPYSTPFFKVGVILSLLFAVILISDLISKNKLNPQVIKLIILAEIIGTSLLLLPTGGIESPFIWYALNPVLLAASYLSGLLCWITLLLFMSAATFLNYTLFGYQSSSFIDVIYKNSYIYLVLTLITIIFQQFSNLTRELQAQAIKLKLQGEALTASNERLQELNRETNVMMDHIMSLYKTTESFTSQQNTPSFVHTVVDYMRKLTNNENNFFWLSSDTDKESLFAASFLASKELSGHWKRTLEKEFNSMDAQLTPLEMQIGETKYWVIQIQTAKYSGIIGVENTDDSSSSSLNSRLLKFMAELSSILLDRFYFEEATEQFLIVEEQNRIANEIHDSVSQRLFAMVCALHTLGKKVDDIPLKKELQFLSKSANSAMQELRTSIYQLSSHSKDGSFLFSKIHEFLDDFSRLNNISIKRNIIGEEAEIPANMKRGIYRIICESSGNAVRHGKCNEIKIHLEMKNDQLFLEITDDGKGFNYKKQTQKNSKGLGLGNIQNLVSSYEGVLDIQSKPLTGTKITIHIPLKKKQEVVGL